MSRLTNLRVWLVLIALIAGLTVHAERSITSDPLEYDALQNASMAFVLASTGAFGERAGHSSMRREPLPVSLLATQFLLDPRLSGIKTEQEINYPSNVIALKQENIVLCFLLLLCVPLILNVFVKDNCSFLLSSSIGIVLTYVMFIRSSSVQILDSTLTEIHTSLFLLIVGILISRAVSSKGVVLYCIGGLFLGALCLIKAVFLYLIVPYAFVLLMLMPLNRYFLPTFKSVSRVAAMIVAAVFVVSPWMARNDALFSNWAITDRGGDVLWIRAVKDGMTRDEWFGAFYVYAPPGIAPWMGHLLGYSRADLELGGRLQRLNRDPASTVGIHDAAAISEGRLSEVISYYFAAKAEWPELARRFREEGSATASQDADAALQDMARRHILDNPLAHAKTTIVFFWRGVGAIDSSFLPALADAIASLFGMTALFGATVFAMVRRRPDVFAVVGLAAGMIAFHSIATHNIPRYSAPAIPIMVIASVLACRWAGTRLRTRFRRPAHTSPSSLCGSPANSAGSNS